MTSSVQVRETPLILSANREGMSGSWFSTGYFGHSRAKARMDLCDFYRQLARPVPPRKFLDRQKSEATTHQFSQHDNRFKMENDPIIRATQSGFGRRKSSINRRGDFDPSFLSWAPNKETEDESKTVFTSVAQSLPPLDSSTYVKDFYHGQPGDEQSKQTRQETFQRYSSTQTRRLRFQQDDRSPSVASCLVWNLPGTPSEASRRTSFQSQSMTEFSRPPSVRLPSIHSHKMHELVSKYL